MLFCRVALVSSLKFTSKLFRRIELKHIHQHRFHFQSILCKNFPSHQLTWPTVWKGLVRITIVRSTLLWDTIHMYPFIRRKLWSFRSENSYAQLSFWKKTFKELYVKYNPIKITTFACYFSFNVQYYESWAYVQSCLWLPKWSDNWSVALLF